MGVDFEGFLELWLAFARPKTIEADKVADRPIMRRIHA